MAAKVLTLLALCLVFTSGWSKCVRNENGVYGDLACR